MGEGWYADPTGAAYMRWFDGQAWTTATLDEHGRTALDTGSVPSAVATGPSASSPVSLVTTTATAAQPTTWSEPSATRATAPVQFVGAGHAWWWTLGACLVAAALLATTWDGGVVWGASCFLVAGGVALTRSGSPSAGLLGALLGLGVGLAILPVQSQIVHASSTASPGPPVLYLRELSGSSDLVWLLVAGLAGTFLVIVLPALTGPRRGRALLGAVLGTAVGVLPAVAVEQDDRFLLDGAGLSYRLCVAAVLAAAALGVVLLGGRQPAATATTA